MNDNLITLPLIPLRGMTIFPNMVMHFDVGREKSVAAIEEAMLKDGEIFLATQKKIDIEEPGVEDIFSVGTICKIKQILKIPNNVTRVLVEGSKRGKLVQLNNDEKCFVVNVEEIKESDISDEELIEIKAYVRLLKKSFKEYIRLTEGLNSPVLALFDEVESYSQLADIIASYVTLDESGKQDILETLKVSERINKLISVINKQVDILKLEKKISTKIKQKIDDSQKEYYLREQIKAIQEELGEDSEENREINKYEEKIKKTKMPKIVKDKAEYELSRLKGGASTSSEGSTIKTYLDWVLALPWSKSTKDNFDIANATELLDNEHYGLEDVKERILEYLVVKKHTNTLKGPILCLVGPPGVGKTSIAKSVANALNRNYVRISLGGIKDEAEIRGHRKTYVGAIPGRIIYAMKEAKSNNPLILFDEIDKLSADYKGNPADALLEVLDAEENKKFRDNYIELDFDLSKTLFITTANTLDTIPRPLLDRMEVIELSGYTYEEKFNIAKKHLIPKVLKEHKLENGELIISDEAIKDIINYYTRESGVRSLERRIAKLVRKCLTEIIKGKKNKIKITVNNLDKYLGSKVYQFDRYDSIDKVGVVTGLAWTAYGGDTLPIEVATMEGTGKLELTGQLGDVMKESAKTAYSYVRAHSKEYGIDNRFYKNRDIHIHVPEGAVPKDGPSAGVTLVTALVSALSNKSVKASVAMTGEVTLTGRVLPIGGVKEKCLSANRLGIKTVILPKDNEKDVTKIPSVVRKKLKFIFAEKVDEVLKVAINGVENNEN